MGSRDVKGKQRAMRRGTIELKSTSRDDCCMFPSHIPVPVHVHDGSHSRSHCQSTSSTPAAVLASASASPSPLAPDAERVVPVEPKLAKRFRILTYFFAEVLGVVVVPMKRVRAREGEGQSLGPIKKERWYCKYEMGDQQ